MNASTGPDAVRPPAADPVVRPSDTAPAARPAAGDGRGAWLFALGGLLICLSMLRFSVQPFAWIAYAPLLVALHRHGGRRRHLALLAVLVVAFHLAVGKIITAPLSFVFTPLFALPFAAAAWISVSLSAAAWRRLGPRAGTYLFPVLVVAFEWFFSTLTSQSSWGSMAFNQSQNLSLLQATTFFGIGGVSFLVALGSSLAASVISRGARAHRVDLAVFLALFAGAHLYGELRLAAGLPGKPIALAGVVSPFSAEEIPGVMRNLELAREKDEALFERTRKAAGSGARLVIWNEAATMLRREDEPGFVARGRDAALESGVDLFMAYGVLVSERPLRFENKYLWIRPDGEVVDEYWKRHPVPSEGTIAGKRPAKVFPADPLQPALGRVGGAICYDLDFPSVALGLARAGAGMVALPSSDWRGIDPLHSDMARIMGIATGMSVLRSVRSATSMASDPYGRVRASRRFEDADDGVMLAELPAVRVPTLYAAIGDVFPIACLVFSLGLGAALLTSSRGGTGSRPRR